VNGLGEWRRSTVSGRRILWWENNHCGCGMDRVDVLRCRWLDQNGLGRGPIPGSDQGLRLRVPAGLEAWQSRSRCWSQGLLLGNIKPEDTTLALSRSDMPRP